MYIDTEYKRPIALSHAARLLGVRSEWLKAEAEAGRLPGYLAGDRWLFDWPQLRAAMTEKVRAVGENSTKKEGTP